MSIPTIAPKLETLVFKQYADGAWRMIYADQIKPGDIIISIGIDGSRLWALNIMHTKSFDGEVWHKDRVRGDAVFVASAVNVLANANILVNGQTVHVGGQVVSEHSEPVMSTDEGEAMLSGRNVPFPVSAETDQAIKDILAAQRI